MKEPCEKCGKRFDMEECMYICPSCGHYHSQVNQYQYRKSRASRTGRQNASSSFHADSRPSAHKKTDFIFSVSRQSRKGEIPRRCFGIRNLFKGKADSLSDSVASDRWISDFLSYENQYADGTDPSDTGIGGSERGFCFVPFAC